MIDYELDQAHGILYVTPRAPLQASDFETLAREVDAYLADEGTLKGLMIRAESFPGWDDFAGLLSHVRFVNNHHRRIEKVAAVTESGFLSIMPRVADHFVGAEVRNFDGDEEAAAMRWLQAEDG